MSKTVSSPDITTLDFSVLFDISTATPSARITNLSTVVNAANLQWMFVFNRPSGYPIHLGTFDTPDVDGVAFTTFVFSEQIPLLFKQIEYSLTQGYSITVNVKDSNGDIFFLTKTQSFCKPNGNTGKNNFGAADIDIALKCAIGQLYVTDRTNLVYKSLTGTKVSTTVKLDYPRDEAGNQIATATVAQLPCLLPVSYDAKGYEIYVAHVFDYDLGDHFVIRVRYSFKKDFAVTCNVTLQPLFCEIDTIANMLASNCQIDNEDTRRNNRKLNVVNAKMLKAHTGMVQPLSGFDVPAIIDEIKELLEVDCDCCRPAGISNFGTALFTDAVVAVNKVCGDMLMSWENDGDGNITLNYQNYSYTFVMSDAAGNSEAFSYQQDITSCNKATKLFVDMEVLSTEILTEITNNPTLLNILNSITQRAQLTCSGLDGGTAIPLTSCDYSVELGAAVSGSTFVSILINGTTYTAPGGTLLTGASTIQTYLNSLSKGTFVVSYSSGTGKTTITSAANTNSISTATTLVSGSSKVTLFSNNCGLICNILQRILTYLNNINLLQIKAGVGLTICRFDPDGTVNSKTFADTVSAAVIATYMADSFCNVVNYVKDRLLTCANLKALFADFTDTTGNPGIADIFYMGVNGACQQVPLKNAAISIIKLIRNDTDVRNEFCLIPPCSTVSTCAPVSSLAKPSGTDTTQTYTWTGVAGAIGYKWSKDGTNYTLVTSTTAFISGLTANTSYTFRVYPVYPFGDGVSCQITDTFITTNTGVTCAVPGSLVLNTITDTSFKATWNAVTGASGYQRQVNGSGWVNIGSVLTTTVTGLTPDTDYSFEVRAIIGGSPCPSAASDSVTTNEPSAENIHLANNISGASFNSSLISGSPYYAFSSDSNFPLTNGQFQTGIHGAIAGGAISVNVTGTYATAFAQLYVNSTLVQCIDVTTPGTHTFSAATIADTAIIDIVLDEGTCGA